MYPYQHGLMTETKYVFGHYEHKSQQRHYNMLAYSATKEQLKKDDSMVEFTEISNVQDALVKSVKQKVLSLLETYLTQNTLNDEPAFKEKMDAEIAKFSEKDFEIFHMVVDDYAAYLQENLDYYVKAVQITGKKMTEKMKKSFQNWENNIYSVRTYRNDFFALFTK